MFQRLKNIGPGAMVAAAFIGPGTVTTATIAGASYGFSLLWTILFSVIATFVLQDMSLRLGVVGRTGLGEAIRQKAKTPFWKTLAAVLVIGAILIGNAAYEAGNISGAVLGFPMPNNFGINPLIFLIGGTAFALLYSGKYQLLERTLVALVALMGFVFLLCALLLQPDWGAVISGLFVPLIPENALLSILGLIGTTVVPYNLFLHASTARKKWENPEQYPSARWEALIAISLGGMITMAIIICAAAAFEGRGKTLGSAADLAVQLQPLLGQWAGPFMAMGFLAAGLSSAITAPLAAAYATAEILGRASILKGLFMRSVMLFILGVGLLFSSLGFKPVAVILFAQVANGLLLPVVALFLLWVMNDKAILGAHVNKRRSNLAGGLVIVVALALGVKSIAQVLASLF
ncbi:MAG TPA: Nramp family divalent metal transporter [Saprospiraceae bacterium]|nr:Nramp family divalent metal transporter [Saprospiraceae bacterium]HMQ84953.1 Nramp family divalent metal transporter [Saprospiraceae bacterium]